MPIKELSLKWGKKVVKTLAFLFTFNAASIPATYLINKSIIPEKNTIVFTSGENKLEDYIIIHIPSPVVLECIDFFMYTPVTLRQNLKGNQVYWKSNPNLEGFVEELQNSEYENIFLIGHGSKDSFALSNGNADTLYLKKFWLPNRNGEFYQYTCGNEGEPGESLKNVLFRECIRSKTFDGILDPITSYKCAWIDSADESGDVE